MIGVGATSLEDDWMNWEDTKLAADRSADWNWEDDTAFGAQF
jgi:hypothetical protein